MARDPNPYRPGFNHAPTTLAGRDGVLEALREALAIAAEEGRTPRPILLVGGRGVGKTVLLGESAAIAAEAYSWLTVPVEVRPGRRFLPDLVEQLAAARDRYREVRSGQRLEVKGAKVRATVLGVGAEVDLARPAGAAPATPLDAALAEACEAADERSAGLLITLDEVQFAKRAELADFAATLQQHVPDHWPLVVVLAGLPSIRDTNRRVTYLERGEWHLLGLLDQQATKQALLEPAESAGRPMTDAACAALAAASGGYPYAIQLLGHHAWRVSSGAERIDERHAAVAVEAADAELRTGLYESRWYDASPKERGYLAALAELLVAGSPSDGAAVARHLGRSTRNVSYLRDRLIRKGTIFPGPEGLRLAVPGMAAWVLRTHGPNVPDDPH
jgi:hypothetical protein